MSDGPLHFTMRELQRMFFAPRFWALIVGASVLLGLTGPFGTYDGLGLPARLAYWAATVVATYFAGGATVFLLVELSWPGRARQAWQYALGGVVSGLPVAAVVWGINTAVFGTGPNDGIAFLPLLGYCVLIAALVATLIATFTRQYRHIEAAAAASPPGPPRPRILDRLPPHLRGALSHMTVQDHYVDIRTDKGGALVLMRLADAIAETGGVEGLQIHRSHWVASDRVAQAVRVGGRQMLKMRDGTLLPVSRSYLDAVRAAGLA